jgi:hypothetical protein
LPVDFNESLANGLNESNFRVLLLKRSEQAKAGGRLPVVHSRASHEDTMGCIVGGARL